MLQRDRQVFLEIEQQLAGAGSALRRSAGALEHEAIGFGSDAVLQLGVRQPGSRFTRRVQQSLVVPEQNLAQRTVVAVDLDALAEDLQRQFGDRHVGNSAGATVFGQ